MTFSLTKSGTPYRVLGFITNSYGAVSGYTAQIVAYPMVSDDFPFTFNGSSMGNQSFGQRATWSIFSFTSNTPVAVLTFVGHEVSFCSGCSLSSGISSTVILTY